MDAMVRKAAFGVLMVACMGCSEAAGGGGEPGAGAAFRGDVSVRVREPGRVADSRKDVGTGSARFVPLGADRSRLEVEASIRRPGDAGFTMEGRHRGKAWDGRAGDVRLTIDSDGRISGGGVDKGQRYTFGGRAAGDQLNLHVGLELMTAGAGQLEPGTHLAFDYALERERKATRAARADAGGRKEKGACKRRVWQTRNVANPGGGGMIMVQVPKCLD